MTTQNSIIFVEFILHISKQIGVVI